MLGSVEAFPLGWRIGHALVAYVAYLGQSFYPLGLAAVYPRSGLALPAWKSVAAFLLLLGITAAALVWWRRRPYLLVGWLWFLGMLLPVIGLVQFGAQAMADRFTYLPQIGLCIVLAWGLDEVCRSSVYRRWIGGVASVLVVGVLMGCAWRQTSFWRDNESLWTHTLACTSRNVLAHYDLGLALAGQGRLDEALTQYRQALEVQPRYADAHNNMAIILVGQGRFDEARVHYQKALAINPDSAEIHNNLAYALACYGRFGEATAHYRKALELDPRCAMAHAKYGVILALQGQTAEALAHYQRALQVDPNYLEVHVKLAWLLATCPEASLRNGPAAIEHARWVDRLYGGREPAVLDVLAAAYAAAGRFPEALLTARQGLELATQKNNRALANTLRARIAWYEAGKPFCQPLPPSAKREP